jgi:hypothetical protein
MPIVAGSGTIQGGSSAFTVDNASATTIFKRGIASYGGNNFGYYENAGVPAFVAGSASDPGWVNPGGSGTWSKINNYATTTVYNRGNHYNTSTTRFTAPVAGPYWFSFTTYLYTDSYVHPIFSVNGTLTSNLIGTQYRIRGHGMVANYAQDAQIEEVIGLSAGDYVEAYWYNSGSCFSYAFYSLFQGAYVG